MSPNQGTFVHGHWIAKNVVITHEFVHKIRNHRSRNGLMLVKVGIKNTFDSLEWNFIKVALEAWGFSMNFKKLVMSCILTVSYNILINEAYTKKLQAI